MTRSSSLAMRHYSVQPRHQIFEKGYGFLSSAINMDKNVIKNLNTVRNLLIMPKQSAKNNRINW